MDWERFERLAEDFSKKFEVDDIFRPYEYLHTGNLALDFLCSYRCDGTGGIPFGTITEIYGDPMTGKSLLLLKMGQEIQKKGGIFYIDEPEGTLKRTHFHRMGINIEDKGKFQWLRSACIEEFTDAAIDFMKRKVDADPNGDIEMMMALDSIAELPAAWEIDNNAEDMGKRAKAIRKMVRRMKGWIPRANAVIVIANHTIESPNPMMRRKITPGGGGLRFGSFTRIELLRTKEITTEDGIKIGCLLHARVTKSKEAFSLVEEDCEIANYFKSGPTRYEGLLPVLAKANLIESKKGGWYIYKGKSYREGQFWNSLSNTERDEFLSSITKKTQEKLGTGETGEEEDDTDQ